MSSAPNRDWLRPWVRIPNRAPTPEPAAAASAPDGCWLSLSKAER